MDKIEKIRQKIKELRELIDDHNYYLDNSEQALGYGLALDDIEKFLDTLSEEPGVDVTDFCKPIDPGIAQCVADHWYEMLEEVDKHPKNTLPPSKDCDHGLREPLESEGPDKSLEEAAEEYLQQVKARFLRTLEHPTAKDAFIAGAGWQASQMPMPEDTVLFNKGVAEGRRLMMEDAVEGEVVKDISNKLAVTAKGINLDGFKFGQKVRIIVLKEEDEK